MKKSIALITTILLCLSILTGCGNRTVTIDLSDYLNALFSGSDGAGAARGDFDYLGFENAVLSGTRSDQFNLSRIVQFESSMVITVSPDRNLENGDKVTVTAAYDKSAARSAGIKISGNTKTFTVEKLGSNGSACMETPPASSVELDAFDPAFWDTANGIVLSYSGISPYGNLEIYNNLPSENPLSRVGYSFSECQNVYEGDTVTVSAYFTNVDMKNEYYFKELTSDYTVGPVDHYLLDITELDGSSIASMKQSVENLAENSVSGFLEFQTVSDYKGFYNGETITIRSNQAGNNAYALRNRDGFVEALVIPCYMTVNVQEPDWMENAGDFEYDLVFLSTISNIIVHADGTLTANAPELTHKGTADIESILMDDLKSGFADSSVESARLEM